MRLAWGQSTSTHRPQAGKAEWAAQQTAGGQAGPIAAASAVEQSGRCIVKVTHQATLRRWRHCRIGSSSQWHNGGATRMLSCLPRRRGSAAGCRQAGLRWRRYSWPQGIRRAAARGPCGLWGAASPQGQHGRCGGAPCCQSTRHIVPRAVHAQCSGANCEVALHNPEQGAPQRPREPCTAASARPALPHPAATLGLLCMHSVTSTRKAFTHQ